MLINLILLHRQMDRNGHSRKRDTDVSHWCRNSFYHDMLLFVPVGIKQRHPRQTARRDRNDKCETRWTAEQRLFDQSPLHEYGFGG